MTKKLAPTEEWRFEACFLDPISPERPTHLLAGVWEQNGCLVWGKYDLTESESAALKGMMADRDTRFRICISRYEAERLCPSVMMAIYRDKQ